MSFRLKTILGIALIEIVLLAILVINGLFYLSSSSETELLTRGQVTVKLFATMTSDAILSMDLATLDTLVEQTLLNDGIIYVRVRGQEGTILSENGNIDALRQPFKSDDSIASARSDGRLDVSSPIFVAGERFGQVEIGLSTGRLEKALSEARQWMLTIAGLEVGLVAIFGMILGTILTKQLAKLREASKRVSEGEFGYQLPVNGKDELAETTVSFNLMSIALANFADKAEEARKKAEAGKKYAETVLHDAMHSMPEGVLITDVDNRVTFINESYKKRYSAALQNIENNPALERLAPKTLALTVEIDGEQKKMTMEERILLHSNPELYPTWQSKLADGRITLTTQRRMSNGGIVIVEHNITELVEALERNRELELELMETGKMESLGTMASGIAHEINTPLQFISDNVLFFQETFDDLASVITVVRKGKKDALEQAGQKLDEIDWEFISEELPTSILDTRTGVKNIGKIVNSIKEFAHPENDDISMHDLNKIVENTIIVSRNQWNTVANVEFHVDEGLDAVPCYPGKLGQVLINLIVNATQAIEESKHGEKGHIKINAKLIDDVVQITVEDDGPGISEDKINQVFDMFFTTKAQGTGTGQGLAICKSIIENTHMGKLSVSSIINKGTTFIITLPFLLKTKDI
ncbi:ATP-binding protein [Kiloniella majae]|uniref:sensor histidine kinase n=1 Tax=Kiloniella majae TaxID=1938558 RepID=UPI000A27884E|nr:ATP-binding protein [Kiloniella majae]